LHATVGAFAARTKTGHIRPAYSHIIAITAGTVIANRWRSDPKTSGDLTRALVFGVTDKIQDDLLREFAPEFKQSGHGIWRKVPYTFPRRFDMGR
jgi:hypothetical protein